MYYIVFISQSELFQNVYTCRLFRISDRNISFIQLEIMAVPVLIPIFASIRTVVRQEIR